LTQTDSDNTPARTTGLCTGDPKDFELLDDDPAAPQEALPALPLSLPPLPAVAQPAALPMALPAEPAVPQPAALPMALPAEVPAAIWPATSPVVQPSQGKRCLVLYGADKKPIHAFPLGKDVILIGRRDPMRGNFPDIDVGEWLGASAARTVSRKHALVLHTRADDSFSLRPLAGNTGTQIEQDMVEPLKDYPLKAGIRLILGGTVRFKFEIVW
jgi:hypothetical protein